MEPGVQVLELHVFYVPAELWNSKLNTISNHAISKFISAGFVRVLPDLSLKALRQQIGDLLGTHTEDDKFAFLKSVGRSLAVVRAKQELELKVKSFAPPYAPQPELYLLPSVEHIGRRQQHDIFTPNGQQLPKEDTEAYVLHPRPRDTTPDENVSSGEFKSSSCSCRVHVTKSPDIHNTYMSYQRPQSTNREETATPKECKVDGFPHQVHRSRCPDITGLYAPIHHRPPSTNPEEITDSREFKGNGFSQEVHSSRSPDLTSTWEQESHSKPLKNTRQSNQKILSQQQVHRVEQSKKETAAMGDVQMDIRSVSKESRIQSNSARDSGVPASLDERDLEYLENKRKKSQRVTQDPESSNARQRTNQMQTNGYSPVTKHYSLFPPPPRLALNLRPQLQSLPTDKEQIIAQINATKQERMSLEKSREELVKKAKELLSQNRLRRNQVRDTWKKKYFESKKVTAPLEETSSNLRQELETYYLKLLQQLEARDTRKQPSKSMSTSNSKNELVIQITTLKYEIDQLFRRVENAKMKLITEIKLRKQTSTDLRALRAELVQKKTQSSLNRLHAASVPHSLNILAT